jgi:ABC-type multidrug transport system fused ATPase/permease subunit
MKQQSKQAPRQTVRFLLGLHSVAPRQVNAMLAVQVLGVIASNTIGPLFVAKLLGQIAKGTASLQQSKSLLVGYVISLIIGEVITPRLVIGLAYVSEGRMQMKIAERVLQSQMDKSISFHSNHMSGGIVSDAVKLNSAIERFWDTIVFTALPIVTTMVSVAIALSFFVWQYALVLFVLSVLIAVFMVRGQSKMAPLNRKSSEMNSAAVAYFADVIANMNVIKAFAGSGHEAGIYRRKLQDWRTSNFAEMRGVLLITGSFSVIMTLLNAVAFLGAILVTQHHLAHL